MFVSISGLWRVGYHADPFAVSVARQGSGRFDDPRRERSVLYGSDSLETCIIEVALPWAAHPDAGYAAVVDEPADDDDAELDRADRDAAARDREIAARPRKMPADLYERARAYARLATPATLLDLRNITARQILSRVPTIATAMETCGLAQLDIGALTGRSLRLTQAIAGHLMRTPFERQPRQDPTCGAERDAGAQAAPAATASASRG